MTQQAKCGASLILNLDFTKNSSHNFFMKIAILGHHSPYAYSGGRYHSWVMAESLADAGHEVTFFTNNKPEFYYDFNNYPGHRKIQIELFTPLEKLKTNGKYDLSVVIPYLTNDLAFYQAALQFSRESNSKVILLNFESPNWFNSVSPWKRESNLWDGYKLISDNGALILSSCEISQNFAKDFYGERNDIKYAYSYPAINERMAEQAHNIGNERSLIICCRFSDKHKGAQDILSLFCNELEGYTFKFILGAGEVEKDLWDLFFEASDKFRIRIKLLKRLDDLTKFEEIKKSQAMVFPSYFEGFGYPPVEARYCDVPCIVYDLPVIREVNGDECAYVERGNKIELKKKLLKVLNKEISIKVSKEIQTVSSYGAELSEIFQSYLKN